ncbi:unnamed protein product [Caenorhabditis auriculariae]|uniref:Elongation factor Ts, mitochondrial n=1 Tax=Caenorhabditis auriculariae TaxID=2777116 RepID=A0A8S1H2C3_9PELO|nr:unnamed protein product [Caenorhabditis auriculariae]
MLARLCTQRFLTNSSIRLFSVAAPVQVDKESLMKLRKRTGYSYVNCRKALVQFGPDKLDEAEKWLREVAVKEGWAKAAKLSNRATTQGLVGVASAGNVAAVVELSCETDFVARGANFKELLEQLTKSVLKHAKNNISHQGSGKIAVAEYDLETLKNEEGKTLREVVTMSVGKLGENINPKSLKAYFAPQGASLYGNSHPKDGTPEVNMGRFVSLIALKRNERPGIFPL